MKAANLVPSLCAGPKDVHRSVCRPSLGTLRWRGNSWKSCSLLETRASVSSDIYGSICKTKRCYRLAPSGYNNVCDPLWYGHRRKGAGILLNISSRRINVRSRLETQEGAESTDAIPYSGRDAVKCFLDSAW